MWFATQVADEGDVVVGKIEVAHWLETGVWVNAILMLVGLSIVFTASVLIVLITRRTVWDFLIANVARTDHWHRMRPGLGHRTGPLRESHEVMAAVGRLFQDWPTSSTC